MGNNDEEYARTFLIIAPNVIVLERLKLDFSDSEESITYRVLPQAEEW